MSAVLDPDHYDLARLFEILAPGRRDLVMLLEAYFDESGSHDGSEVLCVAGYVFEKINCLQLDADWAQVLRDYSLPFFRMTDCAHGNKPFAHLSKPQRIAAETRMIEIIRKYMAVGVSVTVRESDFYEWTKAPNYLFGSAYTWCCYMCLIGVAGWVYHNKIDAEIAYFFEAGHQHQKQANAVMASVLDEPDFRYKAHAFLKKQNARPLQSADLLAWQAATFRKRYMKGITKPRADFRALVTGTETHTYHGTRKVFDEYYERLRALDAQASASLQQPS